MTKEPIKHIKGLSQLKNFKIDRQFFVFIVCLLISCVLWLLIALSKDYSSIATFPVKYVNEPSDKVIINDLPTEINVEVNANGFYLMSNKLISEFDSLEIDLSLLRKRDYSHHYLATSFKKSAIARQLGQEIKIASILPDTINFTFEKKLSKKVPINFNNISVSFEDEYLLNGRISSVPDSITITGPISQIRKLKSIKTEQMTFDDLDRDVEKKIFLDSLGKRVKLSANSVLLKIPVDKYTRSSVQVSPTIINLYKNYSIKIFPDKVKLNFLAAVSNVDKINSKSFQVVVDCSQLEKNNTNQKLKVSVLKSPPYVKNISVDPSKVEFIVKRK